MHQIRKTAVAIKGGPGGVGIYADKNAGNQVKVNDGVGTAGVSRVVTVANPTPAVKTAAYSVVLPEDNGKRIACQLLASFAVTLPAVSAANKGMQVTVINALLPTSGAGYSVAPAAADRIGYRADNTACVNTAATDVLGDFLTVESDGVDGWQIVGKGGIWT